MKRLLPILAALSMATGPTLAAPNDAEVDARRSALEVAGAFANDGFKIRDGYWSGPTKVGESRLVKVNLYAGNQYWFCLSIAEPTAKVAVSLYDENGKPMKTEPYEEGPSAAAGFAPTTSGPYFIKLEELEGAPSSFCLLYSYK